MKYLIILLLLYGCSTAPISHNYEETAEIFCHSDGHLYYRVHSLYSVWVPNGDGGLTKCY